MTDTAETYFEKFLKSPLSKTERVELVKNKTALLSGGAFSGEPAFGTGGMRAVTGLGSNRLNLQNIARLNLAVAAYFMREKTNPLLVMAYDSRLTSPAFSRLSYHILTHAGMRVKVFKRPTPTPLLSFAVRELAADCGIVLTASHNPPQYNGYKAYGADGGQIVSPVDKEIQKLFLETPFDSLPRDIARLADAPIAADDLIEEEIYAAYITRLTKEAFYQRKTKRGSILYSPLHGTGGWLFQRAFRELGYDKFRILPEQEKPDGTFPTVKSPNPEERAAFEYLVKAASQDIATAPDILIATDPDADRVGAMVRTKEKTNADYHFLTGNQIGSLLLESIIRKKANLLAKPFICKTIVTTELQRLIAESYRVKTVETLTGFKYIASEIAKDSDNYLFGGEESFGYLPVNWVRDKDSVSSALALTELAEDEDLVSALDALYVKHGLFHELLHSIDLSKTPELLKATLQKLENPRNFFEKMGVQRKLVDVLDLRTGAGEPSTTECRTLKQNLGHADVIQFWLERHSRLTLRPSGTEPKVKVYLSLMSEIKPTHESLADDKVQLKTQAEELLKSFLKALGVA